MNRDKIGNLILFLILICLGLSCIILSNRVSELERHDISNSIAIRNQFQQQLMFVQAFEDIRTNGVPKTFKVEVK